MDKEKLQEKKRRERSTPYPGVTLDLAIEMITELKRALGKGPYSRQSIAKGLGHKDLTGPAARKVAALTHYGLLSRNGDVYVTSKLTEDILHPRSEEEKKNAIILAAKTPRVFAKLIQQYQGQSLPRMLDSILIREGIGSNAAKEAAEIFTKTLESAGLLQNGVVMSSLDGISLKDNVNTIEEGKKLEFESNDLDFQNKEQKKGFYSFSDSGGGWNMVVKSEKPLTSKIKKMLVDISELLEGHEQE